MSNKQREKTVSGLRSYLRSLTNRRSSGTVTADDAHTYLTKSGVREQMVRTRLSFINSAFSNGFEAVGEVASNRPAAKGRYITEWTTA
jgi:hypothetical protein